MSRKIVERPYYGGQSGRYASMLRVPLRSIYGRR